MKTWDIDVKIDTCDLEIEAGKDVIEIVMHYEYSPVDPEVGYEHDGMDYAGWDFKNPADKTETLETAIEDYIRTQHLDEDMADKAMDDRDDYIEYCRYGAI